VDASIITTVITLFGSLFVAAITYWFTKKREREAEWRKEKLAYYESFIDSLSGIVEGDSTPEGHREFAQATNNLLLFAPQTVLSALNDFRFEISVSNIDRCQQKHDRLLAVLLLAIRRDIGVSLKDETGSFKPILWASGVGRNTDQSDTK